LEQALSSDPRTAAALRCTSFTLDGEAVVCGPDGVAIFDALHRRGTVSEAMLYAFDLLELDGQDLRAMPPGERKKRLAKLVGKRRLGIVLSERTDEDGAKVFRQACEMNSNGIVSKRLNTPYASDRRPGVRQSRSKNSLSLLATGDHRKCKRHASPNFIHRMPTAGAGIIHNRVSKSHIEREIVVNLPNRAYERG
jgi:ATP-dependent DNA ligase